ncbi:hypothetical protein HDU76_000985 [Blyttiomyces sp. JEL0837]|nr:hypothetical protein HDU76_000985 [Blyttiomyces sp. JEL0837]
MSYYCISCSTAITLLLILTLDMASSVMAAVILPPPELSLLHRRQVTNQVPPAKSEPTPVSLPAIIGCLAAVVVVGFLATLLFLYFRHRKHEQQLEEQRQAKGKFPASDLSGVTIILPKRPDDYPLPKDTTVAVAKVYKAAAIQTAEELEAAAARRGGNVVKKDLGHVNAFKAFLFKNGRQVRRRLSLSEIVPPHLMGEVERLKDDDGDEGNINKQVSGYNGNGSVSSRSTVERNPPKALAEEEDGSPVPFAKLNRRSSLSLHHEKRNRSQHHQPHQNQKKQPRSQSQRPPRQSSNYSFNYESEETTTIPPAVTAPGSSSPKHARNVSSTSSLGALAGFGTSNNNNKRISGGLLSSSSSINSSTSSKYRKQQQQSSPQLPLPTLQTLPPRNAGGPSSWSPPAPTGARFPVYLAHIPDYYEDYGYYSYGAAVPRRQESKDEREMVVHPGDAVVVMEWREDGWCRGIREDRPGGWVSMGLGNVSGALEVNRGRGLKRSGSGQSHNSRRSGSAGSSYSNGSSVSNAGNGKGKGKANAAGVDDFSYKGSNEGWFPIVCIAPPASWMTVEKLEDVSVEKALRWQENQMGVKEFGHGHGNQHLQGGGSGSGDVGAAGIRLGGDL